MWATKEFGPVTYSQTAILIFRRENKTMVAEQILVAFDIVEAGGLQEADDFLRLSDPQFEINA